MRQVSASVDELIADRLDQSGPPGLAADLVLAAMLGEDELAASISDTRGTSSGAQASQPAPVAAQTGHLYLQAMVVEGFRGIGPQAALRLQPGPGLTVVAGRNGSGKSSFAEAAELALTGSNKRWSDRSAVWREGWRNLHTPGDSKITVELAADGQQGVIKVTRDWPAGAGLDGADSFVQIPRTARKPLEAVSWSAPLELYRPFLSYSELGALVSGKPTEMYDAMQAILGLDQLVSAERRLTDARRRLEDPSKQATRALPALRAQLASHPDERARDAETALAQRPWDLETIEALTIGADSGSDPVAGRLAQVTAITLPASEIVTQAIGDLRAARQHVAALLGTRSFDARQLAGLLSTALAHQASHPGEPCPVCGGLVLDEAWAEQARTEVKRLTEIAQDADNAQQELDAAARTVRNLIGTEPPAFSTDLGAGVDASAAREAWRGWASLASSGTVEHLVADGEARFAAVASAVTQLRDQATAVLDRRRDAWRPIAAALAGWAELARSSLRAEANLAAVRKAITWLRDAGQDIRSARMAPFAAQSAEIWGLLRQESNVDLGPIRLLGAGPQRHVTLDVTVDGVAGAALGVMSQGELHALGLALFLPRATTPDSPFRFVVVDDPVQSMDPAKVEGLARLLARVGQDRQVIVFTHDDRLPEAIRRLQLPATIWEVSRREGSIVELTKNDDPVRRYLDDARAMARTDELSEGARAVVVAGYCRNALEAACHEAIRARRIRAGTRHTDVERELMQAQKLRQVVGLALFDDMNHGAQVVNRLRERHGQSAVNAFMAAKDGTHGAFQGQLPRLVEETARLAAALRS
jgi:recombinational DNA repair ATPase RecF